MNKINYSMKKEEELNIRRHLDEKFEQDLLEQLISGELKNTLVYHPMVVGQCEIERRWNLQSKLYPKSDGSLSFINFNNCSGLIENEQILKNWNFFKFGSARKMREIAINAPSNADTIIYCDDKSQPEGIILLEISKDILYPWVLKELPEHVIKGLFLDDQKIFYYHFKLLNESLFKLPIGSSINHNEFDRYIFLES